MYKFSRIIILLCAVFFINYHHNAAPDTKEENLMPTNLKKLTVKGTNIIEAESGSIVYLRGVNFTGGVWAYPGTTDPTILKFMTSEWDFKTVKSWGANVITFYMDYAWFTTQAGFKHMEHIFNWCRKYDIYIIPHINVCPGGQNRGGAAFFESQANKQKLLDFWVEFAKRYKHREEIAGYCFIDEPHAVGSDIQWPEMPKLVKAYMERVINAVRVIDKITPIHIQTIYGDPYATYDIDRSQKGIVYNYHFYLPMGYTSAGYTWIGNAGIPLEVSYPGKYVTSVQHNRNGSQTLDFSIITGSTAGEWWMIETAARVPRDGTNAAYLNLYCKGDKKAVIYFDDFSYNTDGGDNFKSLAYGSFEEADDWDNSIPLVWIKWYNNGRNGTGKRSAETAHDGGHSLKFSNCAGLTYYENIDYWLSSAGAIEVSGGQTLKLRYWVKIRNGTPDVYGIQIKWATIKKDYLNKAKLQSLIKQTIIKRRNTSNRPVFIGEFSPSLASKRPDNLNYLNDVLEYFNQNNLSWSFYSYRSPYTNPDRLFLGIIYAKDGFTTDKYWYIDNEVLDVLKRYF
ncbi:MAG: cellulase family glycosylhydrolase [Spirochaetales bacterium]|nr:cellulase family glycosylhydrolase [Spirochaetales bacterium]